MCFSVFSSTSPYDVHRLWGAPRIHGDAQAWLYGSSQSNVCPHLHGQALRTSLAELANLPTQRCRCHSGHRSVRDPNRDLRAPVCGSCSRPRTTTALCFAVIRYLTAERLPWQIVEAFPWDTAPGYPLRDNDAAYGAVHQTRADDGHSEPSDRGKGRMPRRATDGTLRRDRLDHIAILGAPHLRRVLTLCADYYTRRARIGRSGSTAAAMTAFERHRTGERKTGQRRGDGQQPEAKHRWVLRILLAKAGSSPEGARLSGSAADGASSARRSARQHRCRNGCT